MCVHLYPKVSVTTKDFVSIDVWKRSLTSWWDAVCSTPNEQGHHLAFASLYLYPSVSSPLFRGSRRSCLKQLANSFKRPILMSYSCANTLFCGVVIAFEMLIDVWHSKLHNRFLDQISNRVGILINNKHEYILQLHKRFAKSKINMAFLVVLLSPRNNLRFNYKAQFNFRGTNLQSVWSALHCLFFGKQ